MLEEKLEEERYSEEGEENNIISTNESFESSKKFIQMKNKVFIRESKDEWYEGEVDDEYRRNGYGKYHYEDDSVYEGEFEDGLRSGNGDYKWTDGSVFRGEWLNDRKNGFGSFKYDIHEFCGQWENDFFLSGFIFKINLENPNDREILSVIDKEECEEFSDSSHKFYSKTNSFCTNTPLKKMDSIRRYAETDENLQIKNFFDKIEKKFSTFHRMSKSIDIDVDLINFKQNTGDINIMKNLITSDKTYKQSMSLHTANNSIASNDSYLRSSINTFHSTNSDKSRKLIKAYNIPSTLLKDVEFKCRTCLLISAGVTQFNRKCTCDQLKSYICNYARTSSNI
jgi:hypothetical protein